jgi:hypothetical protein
MRTNLFFTDNRTYISNSSYIADCRSLLKLRGLQAMNTILFRPDQLAKRNVMVVHAFE